MDDGNEDLSVGGELVGLEKVRLLRYRTHPGGRPQESQAHQVRENSSLAGQEKARLHRYRTHPDGRPAEGQASHVPYHGGGRRK